MTRCRGQGYDGAGAMAGGIRGVAKRINDVYPEAIYCHCCSHRLNLCVGRVVKVDIVRNAFDVCRVIADLLTDHAKEKRLYEATAKELYPNRPEAVKKLIDFCRTRWVQPLNGINRFVECFIVIFNTLRKIKDNVWFDSSYWRPEIRVKADGLFTNMKTFNFIVALVIAKNVLSFPDGITTALRRSLRRLYQPMKN